VFWVLAMLAVTCAALCFFLRNGRTDPGAAIAEAVSPGLISEFSTEVERGSSQNAPDGALSRRFDRDAHGWVGRAVPRPPAGVD